MNDRKLVVLAAKAASFVRMVFRNDVPYVSGNLNGDDFVAWNPLTDDGDALQLAVKLGMTVRLEDPAAVIAGWAENQRVPFTTDGKGPWFWKEWGRVVDPQAATRRAIVRAAAEIGRAA